MSAKQAPSKFQKSDFFVFDFATFTLKRAVLEKYAFLTLAAYSASAQKSAKMSFVHVRVLISFVQPTFAKTLQNPKKTLFFLQWINGGVPFDTFSRLFSTICLLARF